jgi:hypothetical protein
VSNTLSQNGSQQDSFTTWQAQYATHGVPTFSVRFTLLRDGKIDKRPAIRNYMKIGLRASTELTRRFANAEGIGFALGRKTALAVVDIDTTNENVVADVLAYYGDTPLIARTPSGGYHIYYRHNGAQRRRIREPRWLERGAPVDLLGNGFIVAPPSRNSKGSYRFEQGGLDDLQRLPTIRAIAVPSAAASPIPEQQCSALSGMREHDGRNNALFAAIGPIARGIHRACGTREHLFQMAMQHNSQCAQPMEESEVSKIVENVWGMTREGRNYIGVHGLFCLRAEHLEMEAHALQLLAFLRAHQGPHAVFWCSNGLADQFGWDRRRFAHARQALIEQGYIVLVRQAGRGRPALYRWGRY